MISSEGEVDQKKMQKTLKKMINQIYSKSDFMNRNHRVLISSFDFTKEDTKNNEEVSREDNPFTMIEWVGGQQGRDLYLPYFINYIKNKKMEDKNSLTNNITPSFFYLSQNYPNLFRESTTIKFCIGSPCRAKLTVYDDAGEEIKILVDEEKDPGTYEVAFNIVETHRDASLRARIYYYRLEAGDFKCEKEMELIE